MWRIWLESFRFRECVHLQFLLVFIYNLHKSIWNLNLSQSNQWYLLVVLLLLLSFLLVLQIPYFYCHYVSTDLHNNKMNYSIKSKEKCLVDCKIQYFLLNPTFHNTQFLTSISRSNIRVPHVLRTGWWISTDEITKHGTVGKAVEKMVYEVTIYATVLNTKWLVPKQRVRATHAHWDLLTHRNRPAVSCLIIITEHSTCFSANPVEAGCNVCIRTYCCYFQMKDNYVTPVSYTHLDVYKRQVLLLF